MFKALRFTMATLVMVGVSAAVPSTAASPSKARTYINGRWGYRIDVPRSLVAQPEPEDGGGLAFISSDGNVKLYTSGWYDVEESLSVLDSQRYAEFDWIGSSGRVTYRASGKQWFVSSGITDSGRVFYQRFEQRSLGDGTCRITFTITFPESMKKRWNPLTEQIAKSFRVPQGDCQG
jgi:hypothetical protein